MDVKEFILEASRMCDKYNCCDGCPAQNMDCTLGSNNHNLDEFISIVKKWSEEHKQITNMSKLIEVVRENFPECFVLRYDDYQTLVYVRDSGFWDREYKGDK